MICGFQSPIYSLYNCDTITNCSPWSTLTTSSFPYTNTVSSNITTVPMTSTSKSVSIENSQFILDIIGLHNVATENLGYPQKLIVSEIYRLVSNYMKSNNHTSAQTALCNDVILLYQARYTRKILLSEMYRIIMKLVYVNPITEIKETAVKDQGVQTRVDKPVEPAVESVKPVEPAVESVKPVEPAVESVKPVEPAVESVKPVVEDNGWVTIENCEE